MKRFATSVSFTASTDSAEFNMNNTGFLLAIRIPASFGATSLQILSSDTSGGTFDLVTDESNNAITITTDATTAKLIDLFNIFPLSVGKLENFTNGGFIKFRASSSITKTITVYTGGE